MARPATARAASPSASGGVGGGGDLIAGAVGDDLGEALVVAADERLAVGDEGELAGLEGQAVALALLLAAPDRGDLRPAVGRAGHLQVIHVLRLRADDGGPRREPPTGGG